jgi:DNA replication protein DnaC
MGGKPWLLLMGNVGTGKTVLLRSLWRYFRAIGRENERFHDRVLGCGDFIHGVLLDSAVRIARYNEGSVRAAIHAGALLIDDLGVEPCEVKVYGSASSPTTEVLCERYERRNPTVISTNLSVAEIGERYGERLSDRIQEVSDRIAFNFKSFRQP